MSSKRKRAATVPERDEGAFPVPNRDKDAPSVPDKDERTAKVPDKDERTAKMPDKKAIRDSFYLPEGVKEADPVKWRSYLKSIHESEGFELKDFPGLCPFAWLKPMNVRKSTSLGTKRLVPCAERAITKYNIENGTSYEVDEIISANRKDCAGFVFYITFSVVEKGKKKEKDDNSVLQFQARVYDGVGGVCRVDLVRPKP